MTLIYPNPIWIPSVKRRKVDADFSACAISGYKIKSSSDGMNCVPAGSTVNPPVPTDFTMSCKSQGVGARCMGAIALLLAAALGLGVGEAQTQTAVCSNTPGTGERIECTEDADSTDDIDIAIQGVDITTNEKGANGVQSSHQGLGNTDIVASNVKITTVGDEARGIYAHTSLTTQNILQDALNNIFIEATHVDIITTGLSSNGIEAWHESQNSTGNITVKVQYGTINTDGLSARGISVIHQSKGNIFIDVRDLTIRTIGQSGHGVFAKQDDGGLVGGDVNIYAENLTIETSGVESNGIVGWQEELLGDVNIDAQGVIVTTMGENAHGIAGYQQQSGIGSIDILVNGGTILASGMDASGVQVGHININSGAVVRAAGVDGVDGYRRQIVTVNGRVFGGTGEGAGVFLAGGGKVIIGPNGSVGAESGVAIRAAGQDSPKLHLTLNPGGRRIARVLDDDYIVNDGGQTHILFNGVVLHHGDNGNTGDVAPNGAFDVTLKDEGVKVTNRSDPANWVITELADDVTDDRDFSADDFIEVYAPRAALYEALPGLLLRLNGRGPAAERPRSPLWIRLSGSRGSYEPDQAGVGAEYDFERFEVEVGVNHPLGENLSGSAALRHVQGSGEVSSPAGGGEIDATGIGISFGTHWSAASGNYLASRLSLTDYDVDISTDKRGRLKGNGGALGHLLSLEAGRRAALNERVTLTPRAWLTRSGISMNFTDKVGSRVSLSQSRQLTGGLGVVAETERVEERKFAFRGSLGVDRILSGDGTTAKVSGEKLESESDGTRVRVLLSLGGTYRSDNFAFSGGVSVDGLSSDDREYSGRLNLEMRF